MKIDTALKLILEELNRAQSIHPFWPDDHIHQAAILGEEAGEVLQATLDYRYFEGDFKQIEKETIQTAAMALRLLIGLKPHNKSLKATSLPDRESKQGADGREAP